MPTGAIPGWHRSASGLACSKNQSSAKLDGEDDLSEPYFRVNNSPTMGSNLSHVVDVLYPVPSEDRLEMLKRLLAEDQNVSNNGWDCWPWF